MEAVVLASFLNTLLPRIWEALEKGAKSQAQLVTQIEYLQEELPLMAASIEDYESLGMATDRKLRHRELISKIRRLAQDIEHTIELFVYPSTCLLSQKDFQLKMEDLMYRLKSVQDFQKELADVVAPPKAPVDQRPPDLPDMPKDETLIELLDLVKELEVKPEGKVKVISIVGFAGLGKTHRANQLYRSSEVTQRFGQRAWVCAEDMDKNKLLKEIREKLENGASPSNEQQQINNGALSYTVVQSVNNGRSLSDVEWIANCLHENRCFIVIDDIRSTEQWFRIRSAFPKEAKNTMIVVTTTIQRVAEVCRFSGGHVYKLPNLNRGMSLDLLLKEFEEEDRSFAKNFTEELLNKCDGLPLALVTLSEHLLGDGQLTRKTCEDTCKYLGAYLFGMEEDNLRRMGQVLLGKYNGLSGDYGRARKACLLYFSLFPFNHPSNRKSLIRQWAAEGFGTEDEATLHFKTLIDHSIIQAVEVSSDGVAKRCQPPRMMLEYISHKATSEDLVSLFHGQRHSMATGVTNKAKVRRVSLNVNSDSWISCIDLPLVRTLELCGVSCGALCKFKKIKDKHNYLLLRVLDLKICAHLTNEDLEYICDHFRLLRYLSLGDNISVVPRAIENLELLETLDMTRKREVTVLFELIQLPLLRNLLGMFRFFTSEYVDRIKNHKTVNQEKRRVEMSKSGGTRPLYQTSRLERLSGFVAGQNGFPELMSHMRCLKKVKIWFKNSADNSLKDAIKVFIRKGLDDSDGDRLLSVDFTECSSPFKHSDICYPGRLTSLKLKGRLTGFPQFLGLDGIEKLCLSSTNLSWAQIKKGMTQFSRLIYLKLYEDELDNLAQEQEDSQRISSEDATKNAGFEILKQICFSGKTGLPQPGIIKDLPVLTHVYLYSGATQDEEITRIWKKAAKAHPKRPTVWYGAPPLTVS